MQISPGFGRERSETPPLSQDSISRPSGREADVFIDARLLDRRLDTGRWLVAVTMRLRSLLCPRCEHRSLSSRTLLAKDPTLRTSLLAAGYLVSLVFSSKPLYAGANFYGLHDRGASPQMQLSTYIALPMAPGFVLVVILGNIGTRDSESNGS